VLVDSPTDTHPAGRTTTVDDDRLTRAIGPLPLNAALGLGLGVYVGLGLALPLAIRASVPLLIGCNVTGAMLGLAVVLSWLFPWSQKQRRHQLLEQTTSLRLLTAHEFELLVGELLRREGWNVEETGRHGEPDGNIDLWLRRDNREALVQCKRWEARQLGVDEVRKLAGTLLREGLPGNAGMLVTTSTFTPAATAEADRIGLQLIDARQLADRLERAGATELLDRVDAARSAYLCSLCGAPMLLDRSPYGWWIHCPHYGNGCTGKRNLDRDGRRALELLLVSR
jgi:restriction system protein